MKRLNEDANYLEKSKTLFVDWVSTLKTGHKKKVLENLKTERGVFVFNSLVEHMGQDGQTLKKYYEIIKEDLNQDNKKSKDIFCKKLLEAAEKKTTGDAWKDSNSNQQLVDFLTGGLNVDGYESYSALSTTGGVGNSIKSDMEVTDNGLVTQIIRAIVGGNMAIAGQLTASGWDKLSGGDKMSIFNTAKMQSGYNTSNVVAKDDGEARYYVKQTNKDIESGKMTKEEFQQKAFPKTDFKYYDTYSDKD